MTNIHHKCLQDCKNVLTNNETPTLQIGNTTAEIDAVSVEPISETVYRNGLPEIEIVGWKLTTSGNTINGSVATTVYNTHRNSEEIFGTVVGDLHTWDVSDPLITDVGIESGGSEVSYEFKFVWETVKENGWR